VSKTDEKIQKNEYSFPAQHKNKLFDLVIDLKFKALNQKERKQLKTKNVKPEMGYACPQTPPRHPKSIEQLIFLEKLYTLGEENKGNKVSAETAYNFMLKTVDDNGKRLFARNQLLSTKKIKSWFSTRKRTGKKPKKLEKYLENKANELKKKVKASSKVQHKKDKKNKVNKLKKKVKAPSKVHQKGKKKKKKK